MMRHRQRNQKGDTIVEVLIAIAIVSLVLTSAYMLTRRSTTAMQNAQEQTQAQKLVERQIELLRAASASTVSAAGASFCFTGSDPSSTALSSTLQCSFNSSGEGGGSGGGAQYKIAITKTGNEYGVTARWDKLGNGIGSITMYYYEEK